MRYSVFTLMGVARGGRPLSLLSSKYTLHAKREMSRTCLGDILAGTQNKYKNNEKIEAKKTT